MNTQVSRSLVIVEMTHNNHITAWIALNEQDFINKVDSENLTRTEYELTDLSDIFSDDEGGIPQNILAIVLAESSVINICRHDSSEWLAPDDAPSEFEFAKEALLDDLRDGAVMTEAQAREFVRDTNSPGPQVTAVEKLLADYF